MSNSLGIIALIIFFFTIAWGAQKTTVYDNIEDPGRAKVERPMDN